MNLSKSISEHVPFPGSRVFIAPMKTKDIVTIIGSVLGGENHMPQSLEETAGIVAEMLDAGTKSKNKNILRESLADRGASVSFGADSDRTHFVASCLPEDMPFVLQIIAECLGESVFPNFELTNVKKRMEGDLLEEKTDTRAQASAALTRILYDSNHVNYVTPTSVRIKNVSLVTKADLLKFKSLIGKNGLVISIVGDVIPDNAIRSVELAFKALKSGTATAVAKSANKKTTERIEEKIVIKDKTNVDVYMGAAVPLTYDSDLYIPFVTLTNMLGGKGLTNHLMQTLRERDSLTYGSYAFAKGFQQGTEGYLQIWGAFSPDLYEKAIHSLRKEITYFFTKCLTSTTIEIQKERMIGASLIGLSSTTGLAHALHSIGIQGKELSYIDAYPRIISEVSQDDIHAVAALIPFEKFSIASAGTFKN